MVCRVLKLKPYKRVKKRDESQKVCAVVNAINFEIPDSFVIEALGINFESNESSDVTCPVKIGVTFSSIVWPRGGVHHL